MGSKPEREDETPSAGINWKLFLLVAGIIGAAFFAGMAMQGDGDSISSTVDADSPNIDIGQGSGPDNPPVAVETETPDAELTTENIECYDKYHPIDNYPKILKCPQHKLDKPQYKHLENCLYVTNLQKRNGKIKFCLENHARSPIHFFDVTVWVRGKNAEGMTVGDTTTDFFQHITVPAGEKVCLETRNIEKIFGVFPDEVAIRFI